MKYLTELLCVLLSIFGKEVASYIKQCVFKNQAAEISLNFVTSLPVT